MTTREQAVHLAEVAVVLTCRGQWTTQRAVRTSAIVKTKVILTPAVKLGWRGGEVSSVDGAHLQ